MNTATRGHENFSQYGDECMYVCMRLPRQGQSLTIYFWWFERCDVLVPGGKLVWLTDWLLVMTDWQAGFLVPGTYTSSPFPPFRPSCFPRFTASKVSAVVSNISSSIPPRLPIAQASLPPSLPSANTEIVALCGTFSQICYFFNPLSFDFLFHCYCSVLFSF